MSERPYKLGDVVRVVNPESRCYDQVGTVIRALHSLQAVQIRFGPFKEPILFYTNVRHEVPEYE